MESKLPSRSDRDSQSAPRKPYRKPQLQVYGDLAQVTKSVIGSKTNDGGGHPNKHFTS